MKDPCPQPWAARKQRQHESSWAQGLTGKLSWTQQEPRSAKVSTMMTTRTNRPRPPSVHSWPPAWTREAAGEPQSHFSRAGRRGRRGSPTRLAISHLSLASSSGVTLSAALSATGGNPPSNTTNERARPSRPTRKRTRGPTGRKSVRHPTSGKPRWKCPRTSSPS